MHLCTECFETHRDYCGTCHGRHFLPDCCIGCDCGVRNCDRKAMADRLSRESLGKLRNNLHDGAWSPSCEDLRTILALLDAYEAQRPRPASETPAEGVIVLAYVDGEWIEAYHDGYGWRAWNAGMSYGLGTDAATGWLPLPSAPEATDG